MDADEMGDELEKLKQRYKNATYEVADVAFQFSQELVADNSTDTGHLLGSGDLQVVDDFEYQVLYRAPHSVYVEYGTAPHMPPVDALRGWARRVLGDEELAWAVAMKIKEEGTEPAPFLRPGMHEAESQSVKIIRKHINKI